MSFDGIIIWNLLFIYSFRFIWWWFTKKYINITHETHHFIASSRKYEKKCISIYKYNFILFNKLNGFKCIKPFSLTKYVIAIAHYYVDRFLSLHFTHIRCISTSMNKWYVEIYWWCWIILNVDSTKQKQKQIVLAINQLWTCFVFKFKRKQIAKNFTLTSKYF